jgi:hypothetical protein
MLSGISVWLTGKNWNNFSLVFADLISEYQQYQEATIEDDEYLDDEDEVIENDENEKQTF